MIAALYQRDPIAARASLEAQVTRAAEAMHRASADLARAVALCERYGDAPRQRARSIRGYIRARCARAALFGEGLFEDPAWAMLLDLAAAEAEGERISISSLCVAGECAPTTAMRWVGRLVKAGLIERAADPHDRRRSFVRMTSFARAAMAEYLRRFAADWPEARA